ncbi:MAG TPA: alpha/beta fold hydrolase, partial [Nitrososphaera sp.]|nr:alpha/beta fold hydrolase [Nitrososphaera sp.]
MTKKYLDVRGIRVRMIQAGKGQPLVLLHGLGGSIESWANNIEYLSKKFRVFSLDLPGFGQS